MFRHSGHTIHFIMCFPPKSQLFTNPLDTTCAHAAAHCNLWVAGLHRWVSGAYRLVDGAEWAAGRAQGARLFHAQNETPAWNLPIPSTKILG